MNLLLRIPLDATPEQSTRLFELQAAFAQVCNALAPTVQQTRCWNRVALHHMVYKQLRAQFPQMGSQMVCNAIYSVSRSCRAVFQHPLSPFNLTRLGERPLPLLRFTETCPVYFDRHTLSVKDGMLSMYTLDGRMRFHLALKAEDEANFHSKKLREIVLSRCTPAVFQLTFLFSDDAADELGADAAGARDATGTGDASSAEDATGAADADAAETPGAAGNPNSLSGTTDGPPLGLAGAAKGRGSSNGMGTSGDRTADGNAPPGAGGDTDSPRGGELPEYILIEEMA